MNHSCGVYVAQSDPDTYQIDLTLTHPVLLIWAIHAGRPAVAGFRRISIIIWLREEMMFPVREFQMFASAL